MNEQIILKELTDIKQNQTVMSVRIGVLETNVASLSTKVTSLDTKVTSLDTKVTSLEGQIERVAIEVVGIHEKLDTFVTKQEFDAKFNLLLNGQDKMIKILERLDQERIVTNFNLKNLEQDHDNTKKDVAKIKVQLKMA